MKFINTNIIFENTEAQPTQIDEVNLMNEKALASFDSEVKIPKDVLNSFKIKAELHPKIWSKDKLNTQIKVTLTKIANDFFKELEVPNNVKLKDILFLGSLANYNWSKFSDIDLHLVLDFSQFKDDKDFIKKHFDAEKNLWNQKHKVKIEGFPVEVYVQDVKEKVHASAVYSVKSNKWIVEPDKRNFKVDKPLIKRKVQTFFNKLKDIQKDYKIHKFDAVIKKTTKLKDQIKNIRKAGLENGGEFSTENLVFKVLRRTEFMDILDNFKNKAYDNDMSLNENVTQQYSPELFKKRIPFLKSFNNFSDQRQIFFQKVIYNENVKLVLGEDIEVFPQMNTSSEFYFSSGKINDYHQYNITVKNNVHLMKPNGLDDLMFKVFNMAMKMKMDKLSYNQEIVQKEPMSNEQLNEFINKANEAFFKFEEFANGLDVKNPVD